jgi:hypothetical protein
MSATFQDVRADFDWQPQPEAARYVGKLLQRCIRSNPHIKALADRMHEHTGTRLVDWVDSITLAEGDAACEGLTEAGYAADPRESDCWRHPEGIFPAVRLATGSSGGGSKGDAPQSLAIKVGSVDDFAAAMRSVGESTLEGQPGSQYRICALKLPAECQLIAIERHGWPGFTPPANRAQQIAAAAKHRQAFATRRRDGQTDAEGFELAARLFDAAASDLGRDWACDLFFAAERDYWMSRNAAARVQYKRQQALGLGWGNHDHHTYRNSRENFARLIAILEQMGFECRERFYAGRDAGWGAQVIEQPRCGVVIFADVDLTPEEVAGDFAHSELPPQRKLGTVGLWCKLHGEAFLQAGMHHLECQFDFDAVRSQLAAAGIETMTPFTDWAHL